MEAERRQQEAQPARGVMEVDMRKVSGIDVPGARQVEQQVLRHRLRQHHRRRQHGPRRGQHGQSAQHQQKQHAALDLAQGRGEPAPALTPGAKADSAEGIAIHPVPQFTRQNR
jgi:hypothetical protein